MGRLIAILVVIGLNAVNPAEARVQRASIVLDGHNGAVLTRHQADSKIYPASLTKVMTIYLLLTEIDQGRLSLDSKMTVSARAAARPASKLYLKKGEKISVKLALEALIVRSANDVATVVAEHISGSEEEFARKMTRAARELGMHDTTFKNASGLYNWGQVSTARDLGRLAYAVLREFPQFSYLWSQSTMIYRGLPIRSHNHLLRKLSGAVGMKTGYINASGYNVIAVTERDGRKLITVVLGGRSARERDRTAISLTETNIARASKATIRSITTPLPRPERAATTTTRDAEEVSYNVSTNLSADKVACVAPHSERRQEGWAVQLGAYKDLLSAERRTQNVRQRHTQLAASASAVFPRVTCNGSTLFRARLAGLSEIAAKSLCNQIGRENCLALAP